MSDSSTSGTASRSAATAASRSAGARLSPPSSPRGWRCSAAAPASTAARASRASCSGVTGSASCSPGARVPLSAHWRKTISRPRPRRTRRSTCRSATRPAPCRRCRRRRPSAAARAGRPRRARAGRSAAGGVACAEQLVARGRRVWEPISSVLVGLDRVAQRRRERRGHRRAIRAFSSSSWPSGWPTLTITAPPGASRSRTSSKNSLGGEVERDVGLAVGVEEDRVVAGLRRAEERARVLGVLAQLRAVAQAEVAAADVGQLAVDLDRRRSIVSGSSAPYARATVPAAMPRIATCAAGRRGADERHDEQPSQ